MIRTRRIVACRLCRVVADEYRSRVPNERQISFFYGYVFRCNAIGPRQSLPAASASKIAPFRRRALRRDVITNLDRIWLTPRARCLEVVMKIGNVAVSCSACATRSAAMKSGRPPIAKNDDFRGPGEEVDRAIKRDQFLGYRDIEIPRANDLIYTRKAAACRKRGPRPLAHRPLDEIQ